MSTTKDELREQLDSLFDNYYDGGDSIVIPADESPTEAIMSLFDSTLKAREAEIRIDENNTAFLRILKIGTNQGISAKLLASYHGKREVELSPTDKIIKGA